jgi:hypothetical protein
MLKYRKWRTAEERDTLRRKTEEAENKLGCSAIEEE